MADDPILRAPADSAPAVDLRAWRRAHPDATLTDTERAREVRADPVRATVVVDVATDAPAADGRRPAWGERLLPRWTRIRTLRTAGDEPLALTRPYLTCPARRTELSPLDERLGLLRGSALTPWPVEGVLRVGTVVPVVQAAGLVVHCTGVRADPDAVRRLTEAAVHPATTTALVVPPDGRVGGRSASDS